MKIQIFILPLFLLFISCGENNTSESIPLETDIEQVRQEEPSFEHIDITRKLFDYGHNQHYTDTCAFMFECDCCSSNFLFNEDSSFIYLEYCMSDQDIRIGTYEIDKNELVLNFEAVCVSKEYNYENELDTSAVDFFITDTILKEIKIIYSISKCNERIFLTESKNDYCAIEVKSNYDDFLSTIIKEGYLERFHEIKEKTNHNNE